MRRKQMAMKHRESIVEKWKRCHLGAYEEVPYGVLYGRHVDIQLGLKMQILMPKILVYLAQNTRPKNSTLLSPKYKGENTF